MTTWARLVGNQALDVIVGTDLASELGHRFAPGFFSTGEFSVVPDGTLSSATTSDGSTFTNPPLAAAVPKVLDKTQFNLMCFAALGGVPSGMAAFQAIIDAATAAGGAAKAVVTHYNGSDSFIFSDMQGFVSILTGALAMTSGQAAAILGAWPMAAPPQ